MISIHSSDEEKNDMQAQFFAKTRDFNPPLNEGKSGNHKQKEMPL